MHVLSVHYIIFITSLSAIFRISHFSSPRSLVSLVVHHDPPLSLMFTLSEITQHSGNNALSTLKQHCHDSCDYTRRQINLYRMFFADFSVNSHPIWMKFCKEYF